MRLLVCYAAPAHRRAKSRAKAGFFSSLLEQAQSSTDAGDLAPKLRREPPTTVAFAAGQRRPQFPNLTLHRTLLAKGPSLPRAGPGVRTGYGEASLKNCRCVHRRVIM